MVNLIWKWISLPYSILIVLMGGSAINLTVRFAEKSNEVGEILQLFLLASTNFGYFCGILSGTLVDKVKPAKWIFLVSAVLSLVSFFGLILVYLPAEFGTLQALLCCLFMFMAGLSASIAAIGSIVIVAKNFDS